MSLYSHWSIHCLTTHVTVMWPSKHRWYQCHPYAFMVDHMITWSHDLIITWLPSTDSRQASRLKSHHTILKGSIWRRSDDLWCKYDVIDSSPSHMFLCTQWKRLIKLGTSISDVKLRPRIESLQPNKCCSIIYTVSVWWVCDECVCGECVVGVGECVMSVCVVCVWWMGVWWVCGEYVVGGCVVSEWWVCGG